MSDEFVRAQSRGVIIDGGNDHQLIHVSLIEEQLQTLPHMVGIADDGGGHAGVDRGAFEVRPVEAVERRREWSGLIADEVKRDLLQGSRKATRFIVGFGGDDGNTRHSVRAIQSVGRAKAAAVKVESGEQMLRLEMRGEGEG